MVEFINDTWYRIAWSKDAGKFYTNTNQRIQYPEEFGLGTKATPILSEEDQRRLQGVPSIEETQEGQQERPQKGKAPGITEANDDQGEGTSTRILGLLDQETLKRVLHGDLDKETRIDDELSTLIEKVDMTTTETMTKAAQTTEAYARGGGPADENPMRPSSAIASEVRTYKDKIFTNKGT